MIDYLRKRPIIIAAVGCCVAAVCGYYSKITLGAFTAVLAVIGVWAIIKRRVKAVLVAVIIITMCIGCFCTLKRIDSFSLYQGKREVCNVTVLERLYNGDGYSYSRVEITQSGLLPKGTRLTVSHNPSQAEVGDRLRALIYLKVIKGDRRLNNYSQGVYLSGEIEEIYDINGKDYIYDCTQRLRAYMRNALFDNMSWDSAVTVSALVFGDKSRFSDEYYSNVKAAGVAHVMVVSGMHLSILVNLFLSFLERFVYNPLLRGVIMLITALSVCAVCGFTVSILRAAVTYTVMAFALVIKRRYSGETALAVAVIVMLYKTPFAIFSISFLLSVLSTLGILAVAIPVCSFLKENFEGFRGFFAALLQNAVFSLSSTLLTMPVCVYAFGYISVVAVITNLLISLAVTVALSLAVITLFIYPLLPVAAAPMFWVTDLIVEYVNCVINYLGSREYSTVQTPIWVTYLAVILIFGVFWLLTACKKRIYVLKLKAINEKILRERRNSKWQSFLKRR